MLALPLMKSIPSYALLRRLPGFIGFGRFLGIYAVEPNPEFGFLLSGDLDRIAVLMWLCSLL